MENNQMIHEAMLKVMKGIEAISKSKRNSEQGYNFRGIDDVYNELHSLMCDAGIFTTSEVLDSTSTERATRNGGLLQVRQIKLRYYFRAADGSSVSTEVIGEGMDSSDKASNKALAVAHKYALMQAFLIPTNDDKDPEKDSPEPVKAPEKKAQPAPKDEKSTFDKVKALEKIHKLWKENVNGGWAPDADMLNAVNSIQAKSDSEIVEFGKLLVKINQSLKGE